VLPALVVPPRPRPKPLADAPGCGPRHHPRPATAWPPPAFPPLRVRLEITAKFSGILNERHQYVLENVAENSKRIVVYIRAVRDGMAAPPASLGAPSGIVDAVATEARLPPDLHPCHHGPVSFIEGERWTHALHPCTAASAPPKGALPNVPGRQAAETWSLGSCC
jgi:hypothetical protein